MTASPSVIVIGAGPAGLTAAHELLEHDLVPLVLEQDRLVGGISRTEEYRGYRFDIGGHRFYTKVEEVQQLWEQMLGQEFKRVGRLSRIFYGGQFYNYPLKIMNTLTNLGLMESTLILLSYLSAKIWPSGEEETLEQWVTNRFGRRLFETFFQTYTEKVWGIPCSEIRAEWAAQRIQNLSLRTAALNAIRGGGEQDAKSLINEFHYPTLGPGMMWEAFQKEIDRRGGEVRLDTRVVGIQRSGDRITSVLVEQGLERYILEAPYYISTMPLSTLIRIMDPPPPDEVVRAAQGLKYRAFVIAGLIINRREMFPDNWIYIHSPDVKVGRIQNFKNWSPAMVPDPSKTSLGLEYFCDKGDDIWNLPDDELISLATRELRELGLADPEEVEDGYVIRQPGAYPVYDGEYRKHLDVIQDYLTTLKNLQTIGRNGMHRYNNQDHSMLTGLLAARNLVGESNQLWDVNTERSYYEEVTVPSAGEDSR
jgi:protoporphyrinogen oxidase